jgi:hypothetical protein
MDAREAKQKAKSILEHDGIDKALIRFYLAVHHYPAWITQPDFATRWNFGVSAIRSVSERIGTRKEAEDVPMVIGVFDEQIFKIGGYSYFVAFPDGDSCGYERIRFGYGKDLSTVIEAEFSRADEAILPSDYSLIDVEGFHRSSDWIKLLHSACRAIDAHEERMRNARVQEENNKYEGKFSF